MKIAWFNNKSVEEHSGGAQQTNKIMIDEGLSRGHSITQVTSSEINNQSQDIVDSDLVILNNITDFHISEIEYVIQNKRYVRYEHDYDSIDLIKQYVSIQGLFEKSLLNIFLSPLHAEEFKRRAGRFGADTKVFLQASPVVGFQIETEDHHDKNKIICVGNFSHPKGFFNVISFANSLLNGKLKETAVKNFEKLGIDPKELQIDFYGWGSDEVMNIIKNTPNCHFIKEVKNSELADIYRQYGWFIHLPAWKEPFGRTVMEAFFSGCKLIISDKFIGARSFNWNWNDRKEMEDRNSKLASEFWNKIESL